MMSQIDMFEAMETQATPALHESEPIRTENTLTSRQWKLYTKLKEHSMRSWNRLQNKEMLEMMDHEYGYSQERREKPDTPFNNLVSRRELSDDLDAIIRSETVQLVYVGGRFAKTATEREVYQLKERIRISKEWKKWWIQAYKSSHDGQMRLTFNTEKDHWDANIKADEDKLQEMERKLKEEMEIDNAETNRHVRNNEATV